MQIETFEKRAVEYINKHTSYYTDMGFPHGECSHLHFDYHMHYNIATGQKMYDVEISQYLNQLEDYPLVQVTGESWNDCVEKALRVLKAYGPKPTRGQGADDSDESDSVEVEPSEVPDSSTFSL